MVPLYILAKFRGGRAIALLPPPPRFRRPCNYCKKLARSYIQSCTYGVHTTIFHIKEFQAYEVFTIYVHTFKKFWPFLQPKEFILSHRSFFSVCACAQHFCSRKKIKFYHDRYRIKPFTYLFKVKQSYVEFQNWLLLSACFQSNSMC